MFTNWRGLLMIRLSVILIFILLSALSGELLGQSFRGRVLDIITKKPIIGATVKSSSSTSTNAFGDGFFGNDVQYPATIGLTQ